MISLLKRLQVEELAQKSEYNSDILSVAEQINQDWWEKNVLVAISCDSVLRKIKSATENKLKIEICEY